MDITTAAGATAIDAVYKTADAAKYAGRCCEDDKFGTG